MFAVVKTGGKQYIVRPGELLNIEKLEMEPGAKLELEAMLVANEDGGDVRVGKPMVAEAKVEALVAEHGRAKKVSVVKYKPKVRYRRNVGHRQPFTKIKIEKIAV
jgi:large subunit ribosomal protein L21